MTLPYGRLTANTKIHIDDVLQSKCVAYIGPNGSGKTSRLEAFELAVKGARSNGKLDDLAPSSTPGAKPYALLDVGDRSFDSRQDSVGNVQIVRPATWLIQLGPGRAREEVVARWGGDTTAVITAPDSLTQAQKDVWNTGVKECRSALQTRKEAADAANVLAELQGWARRAKLAHGREADALRKSNEQIQAAMNPSDVDIAILESQRDRALAWERAAVTRVHREALAREWEEYAAIVNAFNALEPLPTFDDAAIEQQERALQATAKVMNLIEFIQSSPSQCPCCGGAYDASSSVAHYQTFISNSKEALQALQATKTERERVRMEHVRRAATAESLRREHARLTANENQLPKSESTDPYEGSTSAQLTQALNEARRYEGMKASVSMQVERIRALDNSWTDAQAVEQAAGIELKNFTAQITSAMNAAIDKHLPGRMRGRFLYNLEASRFEMIGVDNFSHAWREQSGGELASLSLAAALAWAGGQLSILLLEYERDVSPFDQETQQALLAQIADACDRGELLLCAVAAPCGLYTDDRWDIHVTTLPEAKPLAMLPVAQQDQSDLPLFPPTRALIDAIENSMPATEDAPAPKRRSRGGGRRKTK